MLQDVLMSSQYALSVRYHPMGFACLRRVMIRERGLPLTDSKNALWSEFVAAESYICTVH